MQHKVRTTRFLLAALLGVTAGALSAEKPSGFDRDIAQFVNEMSVQHGFESAGLRQLMEKVVFRQSIIDAITRPAESKPWWKYRPIFLTSSRISQGVTF